MFDLDGMNCVVDAACASSLVALKVAIDEILHGDCDTMIAGATCTYLFSPEPFCYIHTHTTHVRRYRLLIGNVHVIQ